ncbi:serine/threonine-protein kinase pakG [Myzus persicae]|uniref:serine/threonine-protein kinase pakG n=1 Tax=Myzus persicae TaxID=13164 RepID=UPI000B931652|nr:serine/threonine-protein kinase pakG [Myzus persicae]XP_022162744.1 serine/threonine-protein kinase pakG [Myzus persicae]XP_022162745.1 serine/threonine-protein kinase pakG [Myzus persicae]
MVVPENGTMCDNIMRGIEKNGGGIHLHNRKQKLKQKFDILKKLGEGSCGKVQLGICKETEQLVAIKTIRKRKIETEADLIRIRREIQIMSSVRHPNIIHIYEVFENREKIVLVMEYAAGGELYDFLSEKKVLTEEEARRIFRQVAIAIFYCHKHNICHRDLKLENILLDEQGNAKIADFGLSNVFNHKALLSTYCGSPLYASPEIVTGTPYHGPEVDCWSLGVLLYTLVYGTMPFDGSNFKRLVRQISQGEYYEPKKPSRASPLIGSMMTVNPNARADIRTICSHQWLNEGFPDGHQCLRIAEEMASSTPVRLDLLLSLAPTPKEANNNLGIPPSQSNAENDVRSDTGPVRSQSLGSISPSRATAVIPDSPVEKKPKKLKKRDRSISRSKKSSQSDTGENDLETPASKESSKSIKNNSKSDLPQSPLQSTTNSESDVVKPVERARRRSSRVLEAVEKLDQIESMAKNNFDQKRRSSLGSGSSNSSKKSIESDGSATRVPTKEPQFSLESTVGLNKLAESALNNEPIYGTQSIKNDFKNLPDDLRKSLNAIRIIGDSISDSNTSQVVEPKRKTSRAEIKLAKPELPITSVVNDSKVQDNDPIDANYKTEVKHFVQVPKPTRRITEVSFPVAGATPTAVAPLPPRPVLRQNSQLREHIIPIRFEVEDKPKPKPVQRVSSVTSPKTSCSNLSRQSTVDTDSNSSIVSLGEPIRKSPREVIIPIAVEGGGFVTPSNSALSRTNSNSDKGDDDNGTVGGQPRCFTLRSTRRQRPSMRNLQSTESISSDEEDDSFEILTAENLFSTLLSRVRDLTNRLSSDEGRTSDFPRSFFNHHRSIFDHQTPIRRLTETRSFNRSDSAPWRRSFVTTTQDSPSNTSSKELLRNADKTTNIQKPPVYKHILPRVLETTTNNEYLNYRDKINAIKLPMSPPPKHVSQPSIYNMPSDPVKERQSRVDRILEKYRRQPSNSCSRQFSRSFSCNASTETAPSTENNLLLQSTMMTESGGNEENTKKSGPRSVSPYALFDRSDGTSTTTTAAHQDFKANSENSLLSKSYSMKSLGEHRTRTLNSIPLSVDRRSISKFNSSSINNDEDPSSSSSSSSATTTTTSSKSLVPKEDNNHYYHHGSPALLDWTIGNCSEETVSDRIRRRSYYVKLK